MHQHQERNSVMQQYRERNSVMHQHRERNSVMHQHHERNSVMHQHHERGRARHPPYLYRHPHFERHEGILVSMVPLNWLLEAKEMDSPKLMRRGQLAMEYAEPVRRGVQLPTPLANTLNRNL